MRKDIPRVLLAGTSSGCGKTTVTCAILQALVNRGMRVGAFKCGPDYIDPMFHSRIIGHCRAWRTHRSGHRACGKTAMH